MILIAELMRHRATLDYVGLLENQVNLGLDLRALALVLRPDRLILEILL